MQVDKKQYEKILSYIEHGKREGATLLAGGKAFDRKGYYIEPTIFIDVKVSMPSLYESIGLLNLEFYEQYIFRQP